MPKASGRKGVRGGPGSGPAILLLVVLALVGGAIWFVLDLLGPGDRDDRTTPVAAAVSVSADAAGPDETAAVDTDIPANRETRSPGPPVSVIRPGTGDRVAVDAATLAAAAGPALLEAPPASLRQITVQGLTQGPVVDGPLQREPTSVVLPPPPPPSGEPYRLVVVLEAGLIDLRSYIARIAHIEAPSAETVCPRPGGESWPCGRRARTELRRLIRRRAVSCLEVKPEDAAPPPVHVRSAVIEGPEEVRPTAAARLGEAPAGPRETKVSECSVAGTDIASWLVEHGWAVPTADAPAGLVDLAAKAEAERRGLHSPTQR